MPGGARSAARRAGLGLSAAPVSRVDGPLKVRGAARFAAEVHARRACSTPRSCFSTDRARAGSRTLDTTAAEAAPGVALVMTYRNAPRLKPPPVFLTRPKAAGGERSCRSCRTTAIHWNGAAGRRGARRDAGAGRSRRIADRRDATTREPAHDVFDEAKAKAAPGETRCWASRRPIEIGDAEKRAGRRSASRSTSTLPHAAPQSQRHRAARGHGRVGWRRADRPRRDADGHLHRLDAGARCSASTRTRCGSLSPFVGGGFGGKALVAAPDPGGRRGEAGRAAGAHRRCRARACIALVGGRTTTEQRVALGADARRHARRR